MENQYYTQQFHAVALHLGETQDCHLCVWSAEFRLGGIKTRLIFDTGNRLTQLLHETAARELAVIWARLKQDRHPIDNVNFQLCSGPATLAGLSARLASGSFGSDHGLIRFRDFVGRPEDLFRVGLPIETPFLDLRETIAIEALADIAAPLLRLASLPSCTPLSPEQSRSVAAELDQIRDRSGEIGFHLSLLTRYIRACADARGALGQHMFGRLHGRPDPRRPLADEPTRGVSDFGPTRSA